MLVNQICVTSLGFVINKLSLYLFFSVCFVLCNYSLWFYGFMCVHKYCVQSQLYFTAVFKSLKLLSSYDNNIVLLCMQIVNELLAFDNLFIVTFFVTSLNFAVSQSCCLCMQAIQLRRLIALQLYCMLCLYTGELSLLQLACQQLKSIELFHLLDNHNFRHLHETSSWDLMLARSWRVC